MARRRRGRGAAVTDEKYRSRTVAEMIAKHREFAGFQNPARALYQTVRELVENSLDATDTKRILPWIYISIREVPRSGSTDGARPWYIVTVEDNGIGVPRTVLPQAFGRVLYSSKYVIKQTRGMFGLGVKAVTLYAQQTTGSPIEVYSSTEGSQYVYMMKIRIDTSRNTPQVLEVGEWGKKASWKGTRVSVRIEGDWRRAKSKIIEYVRRTAIIAPYAEIIFETPDGEIYYYPRATKKMPEPPREAKPHPHGVNLEDMREIVRATPAKTLKEMLVTEFQSVGEKSAEEFLSKYGFDPDMNPKELLKRDNEGLLVKFVESLSQFKFRAPKSDYLSPLGAEIIREGLKRMFAPEWVEAVTRPPRSYKGHPFIVEVGIAYGGAIKPLEEPLLLRYANKIPLLYEEREDVSYKVVKSINWKNYNVDFPAPLIVLVHIASTKVPYKGLGKESISETPELESEIRNAVQEVARKLKSYIARKTREEEAKRKAEALARYIPEVAWSLAMLSKPPEKWAPPKPEEVTLFKEKLIDIVASKIKIAGMNDVEVREIVKKIADSVEVE